MKNARHATTRTMTGAPPLKPDLCVIGGGAAGQASAFAAVALGLSCTVVEKRLPLGRGQARDLALDILLNASPGETYAALRDRIGAAVARMAPLHGAERLRAAGVQVVEGAGRFTDPHTVGVGTIAIRARRFVIASGARAGGPSIPGLDAVRHVTPETWHEMVRRPEHLAVIGSDARAFELAQAFRQLGSAVTLVAADHPGDPELWDVVRLALLRDGIAMHAGPVGRIEPQGTGAILHLLGPDPGTVEVSDLFIADSTTPLTEGIGLDRAGIRRESGRLVLRADLRTTNRRVFAVGDVMGAGGPAALSAQVGTVMRAAFLRQPIRYRPERVAQVLRTIPPLATVGLTEAEARARGAAVRVFRTAFADNEHALATGATQGHLKVVATADGHILGAGVVGARADDLIGPWVLAVGQGLRLEAMATAAFAQPSLSDTSRRAALPVLVARLRSPWVKRALALMRRLG